jgi:hypothetical protein
MELENRLEKHRAGTERCGESISKNTGIDPIYAPEWRLNTTILQKYSTSSPNPRTQGTFLYKASEYATDSSRGVYTSSRATHLTADIP